MKFVFVSYASEDADLARTIIDRLATALGPSGVEVRFDENKATARLFPEWVDEHIVAADRVLVLWSASAAASSFMRIEAEKARSLGKYVACLIDPELNPEDALPPPFNVYLTPLVVMPDLATDATTLALDDEEFGKLAEELAKPPAVPSTETVDVGAAANPQEAAERERTLSNVDPWIFPGSVEPDVAEERLRTLFIGGLARLLDYDDPEVREAAAKYLEAEIAAQDNALSALNGAATRINSQALWNDVGALLLPRRPSDAVLAWRRANFTDAEICRRLGLPLATLGGAAAAAKAGRIIGGSEAQAEPAEAEEAVAAPEEAVADDSAEALEAEADEVSEDETDEAALEDEAPEDEAPEEEEEASDEAVEETEDDASEEDDDEIDEADSDDDDGEDDDEDEGDEPRRRKSGGAGWFLTGAAVTVLLLAGAAATGLYFVSVDGEPLYRRLEAAVMPGDGSSTPPAAAVATAASAGSAPDTADACLDAGRFNGEDLDGQRQALASCGLQLAEVAPREVRVEVPVEVPAEQPAWCTSAAAFEALIAAEGDVTDELAACGVELPSPLPPLEVEPRVETRVETVVETVTCPDPAQFNGLDRAGQRTLLQSCGLTLADEPAAPVIAAAPEEEPEERAVAAAINNIAPETDENGVPACSTTQGPPCRVTLGAAASLALIGEAYYESPLTWCWIYDTNEETFQSETRPELVRGDPNCVYAGDSYLLEALPEGWRYGADCEHTELLSATCPRTLSPTAAEEP